MKVSCMTKPKDFVELYVMPDGTLDITVTQDTGGDRRSDESTIIVSPAVAMLLSEALRRYANGGSCIKEL